MALFGEINSYITRKQHESLLHGELQYSVIKLRLCNMHGTIRRGWSAGNSWFVFWWLDMWWGWYSRRCRWAVLPTVQACGVHLSTRWNPSLLLVPAATSPFGAVYLLGGIAMVLLCCRWDPSGENLHPVIWMDDNGACTSYSTRRHRLGGIKHIQVVARWLVSWGHHHVFEFRWCCLSLSTYILIALPLVLLWSWPVKLVLSSMSSLVVAQSVQ
jgi:hypothetical protein